jgi:hypothetical protein
MSPFNARESVRTPGVGEIQLAFTYGGEHQTEPPSFPSQQEFMAVKSQKFAPFAFGQEIGAARYF